MPERLGGRRRRRYIRLLLAVTAVVVMVDAAAAVLQINSTNRSDSARAEVSAGLAYQANMSTIMQDTLAAETGERGYLLTGQSSYLVPAKAAVTGARRAQEDQGRQPRRSGADT